MSVFNPTRAKVQLKLSINRLKMLQAKKSSLNKHQRREIAGLLDNGKEESARIRVEHIIREDFHMEAMEILELYCELLLARFGLLEQMNHCDPAIAEAVNTIIYAAPRADQVKELGLVRDQLMAKFGRDFVVNAMENKDDCVNARIISKLRVSTPDLFLVDRYLEEIAKTYNVNWKSDITNNDDDDDGDDGGGGSLIDLDTSSGTSVRPLRSTPIALVDTESPLPSMPAFKSDPAPSSDLDLPLPPIASPLKNTAPRNDDASPDFDELAKRFEALKRKN